MVENHLYIFSQVHWFSKRRKTHCKTHLSYCNSLLTFGGIKLNLIENGILLMTKQVKQLNYIIWRLIMQLTLYFIYIQPFININFLFLNKVWTKFIPESFSFILVERSSEVNIKLKFSTSELFTPPSCFLLRHRMLKLLKSLIPPHKFHPNNSLMGDFFKLIKQVSGTRSFLNRNPVFVSFQGKYFSLS